MTPNLNTLDTSTITSSHMYYETIYSTQVIEGVTSCLQVNLVWKCNKFHLRGIQAIFCKQIISKISAYNV